MIKGINHITLAVTNIDVSFHFYCQILGFKPIVKWDKGAYFSVNGFWFCLNVDPIRVNRNCYTHYAFTVDKEEYDEMVFRIRQFNVVEFKKTLLLEIHYISWIQMGINLNYMLIVCKIG